MTFVGFLSMLAACTNSGDLGSRTAALGGGEHDTTTNDVVAIVGPGFIGPGDLHLCTGTVVGEQHVLTAKQCVFVANGTGFRALEASELRVVVGDTVGSTSTTFDVDSIATTPGAFTMDELRSGADVALLHLTASPGATPREIARARPRTGNDVTAMGYGRISPVSGFARRHRATFEVSGHGTGTFEATGPAFICWGDAGGPAIDAAGRVVGVASASGSPTCGPAPAFFTETSGQLAFIEGVLGTAPCTASTDACDGADMDCDGAVDEGCGDTGSPCLDAVDCASMRCGVDGACAAGAGDAGEPPRVDAGPSGADAGAAPSDAGSASTPPPPSDASGCSATGNAADAFGLFVVLVAIFARRRHVIRS
jgi:hypothetical protein